MCKKALGGQTEHSRQQHFWSKPEAGVSHKTTEHLEKHTRDMPTPARKLMFAPLQEAAAASE